MKDASSYKSAHIEWEAIRDSIRRLNATLDKVEKQLTGKTKSSPLRPGFDKIFKDLFGGAP